VYVTVTWQSKLKTHERSISLSTKIQNSKLKKHSPSTVNCRFALALGTQTVVTVSFHSVN